MTILDSDRGATGGLLISIAVAAAALFAVLPQPGPAFARIQPPVAETASGDGEPLGKFEDRLAVAAAEYALSERPLRLPAALLMPMLVGWGTPAADGALVAVQAPRDAATPAGMSQPLRRLPVPRPVTLALANADGPGPAPAARAIETSGPRDDRGSGGFSVAVNAIDRATGAVALAGHWAIGSAMTLLPDWR